MASPSWGFWPARRFETLAELDRVYGDWRDRVAHRRRHATRQFVVADRLIEDRAGLRPLPPARFDFSLSRVVRVPTDGYLRHGACFYRAPVELVHQRVELHASRDEVWICWRGQELVRYPRSYRPGLWVPEPRMRPEPPPPAKAGQAVGDRRSAAGRLRRALRMTPAKTKVGERLPYLLSALKAPRIAERLATTAERAREEQWPYEQFLETLCEAEVFAREASGARTRTRSAGFPAHKTLEDFDFTAQPSAERPLVMHLAQLAWIEEHANVCLIGPPEHLSHCPPCVRH